MSSCVMCPLKTIVKYVMLNTFNIIVYRVFLAKEEPFFFIFYLVEKYIIA